MSTLHDQWLAEGYVVLPGLIDPGRAERLWGICEEILGQWRRRDPQTGRPGADDITMRHLNHPAYFERRPVWFGEVMDVIADAKVLQVVRELFGGEEPLFRCTSLFMNPLERSRDGNWHRDSQFLTKTDEEEQKMIAADTTGRGFGVQLQIPLVPSEDIEYVPGSHRRWDTAEEYRIRKADGGRNNTSPDMPGAKRIPLRPGDGAAFNPMGLHRGRYHADKLRRTLMLTYTPAGNPCRDYFSDQPWFAEAGYLEGLRPETRRFFEGFVGEYAEFWGRPREVEAEVSP